MPRAQDSPSAQSLAQARTDLANRLPGLMHAAATAYERLAADGPPDDTKQATQYHTACKAALSHLDMLAKLARWAEPGPGPGPSPGIDDDPETLLARARSALGPRDGEDA